MKNLEYYRKAKAKAEQEVSKLSDELIVLCQNRDRVEEQINDAIDSEDRKLVEELTEKVAGLDIKINAQKRIIERKKEKQAYTKEDLVESCNDETWIPGTPHYEILVPMPETR